MATFKVTYKDGAEAVHYAELTADGFAQQHFGLSTVAEVEELGAKIEVISDVVPEEPVKESGDEAEVESTQGEDDGQVGTTTE